MSFLDNSGDIILDAVLTDAGRERLARGDGSFKIVKFALGDDEINYENYDGTDLRGSAFYDLEILQTPVLEAFTNNTSNMKSKLITITRTNILYLPIMLLNSDPSKSGGIGLTTSATYGEGILPVSVDNTTSDSSTGIKGISFIKGDAPGTSNGIVIDQGLDTDALQPSNKIPEDLYESQYQIQMDNRLLSLTSGTGTSATVSFVDDDSIASYAVPNTFIEDITKLDKPGESPIVGPRGSRLKFDLKASLDTQSGTYLFTTLGAELNDGTKDYYYIDTTVRVTGLTTGNSMDIPVRLLKRKL